MNERGFSHTECIFVCHDNATKKVKKLPDKLLIHFQNKLRQ